MRIHLISLIVGLSVAALSYSQACQPTITSSATPIKASTSKTTSGGEFWICESVSLFLYGSTNTIWLEDDAVISVTGDSNFIYALQGASITVSGQANHVFYDQNASFNDNGIATVSQKCTPMIFNYSTIPSGGCDYWIGQREIALENPEIVLHPNPANDLIRILLPGEGLSTLIRLFDVNGRLLKTMAITASNVAEVDVSDLPEGLYNLSIQGDDINISRIIVVRH